MSPNEQVQTARVQRGFTLVELLVAIGIIAILVALTFGVATTVADSGRTRATEGAIGVLDQALDAYVQAQGSNPPALIKVETADMPTGNDPGYYPLFDGFSDDDQRPINTVGLFIYECRSVPAVQDLIAGLDPKFVANYRPGGTTGSALQPELTTILDAWGNPIRMVHPRFAGEVLDGTRINGDPGSFIDLTDDSNGYLVGAETFIPDGEIILSRVRRNALSDQDRRTSAELVGDSDGGLPPSPRPYFYSAGPDGDPSTIDDNVYSISPRFPNQG